MIVRHSVFKPDPWGDGGARRTAQITALLGSLEQNIPFLTWPQCASRRKGLTAFVREIPFMTKSKLPLCLRISSAKVIGADFKSFRQQLAGFPEGTLLLWEGTQSRFAAFGMLARDLGHKVIALPHNLESLVPGTRSFYSGKVSPFWLEEEIASLASCDAVFAISREDQWLLRLHNIPAEYLPYYPTVDVVPFLQDVRSSRSNPNLNNDLLLLGTAGNPPTLAGMVDRVKFFAANKKLFQRLHIVGFGTDSLREDFKGQDEMVIHGAVTNNLLRDLLIRVRAAVVHQQPTSGALTRVTELQLAGVPVLVNTDAARSCFRMPGVYVYENNAQLVEMLGGELDPGSALSKPAEFEQLFMDRLLSL